MDVEVINLLLGNTPHRWGNNSDLAAVLYLCDWCMVGKINKMLWEAVFIWYHLSCIILLGGTLIVAFRQYKKNEISRATPDLGYIFFRYQAKIILKDTTDKKENFINAIKQKTRLGSTYIVFYLLDLHICFQ